MSNCVFIFIKIYLATFINYYQRERKRERERETEGEAEKAKRVLLFYILVLNFLSF